MKLYVMDVREIEKNSILEERIFAVLGKQRQEKVERCRHDKDKLRSICAGALLCLGIMEWEEKERDLTLHKVVAKKVNWEMLPAFFEAQNKDVSCIYGANGKPQLLHYPQIHFNLSHSGNYVTAAFDKNPIGIDIQEHRKLRETTARHFLSAWELGQLGMEEEEDREEWLCRLWTIKESYVKLTGEGMKKSMKEIRVNRQNGTIENERREPIAGFMEKMWKEESESAGRYYFSLCSF